MSNAAGILDPLTPQDCDLRDFSFMPLDVVRLRDSTLAIKATGEEFRAAVLLWCASWHQMPAGSLPDDDAELATFAGFGRVVKEFKKIKAGATRGWVKCSDGRLYHPVIAEKVIEAWREKQAIIKLRAADCAKKAARRRSIPRWLSMSQRRQIRDIYQRSAALSASTGVRHEVDHIVPLNGEGVCGLHVPWNLQILTARENLEKSNRIDVEAAHA